MNSTHTATSATGQRVDSATARIRAIEHPVPVPFPLLAPHKRTGTRHTHFRGEIRLLHPHRVLNACLNDHLPIHPHPESSGCKPGP
jgi:hypothetical protein